MDYELLFALIGLGFVATLAAVTVAALIVVAIWGAK
jgi:hypothetical protein